MKTFSCGLHINSTLIYFFGGRVLHHKLIFPNMQSFLPNVVLLVVLVQEKQAELCIGSVCAWCLRSLVGETVTN